MLMQSGGESKSNSHHYSVRFQRKVHHYQYRYITLIYKKTVLLTDMQTNSSNKSSMGENIYSNSIALGTLDSGKGWFAMCMTQ